MSGITDPTEEYFKDGLWGWVTDQWKKLVATAGGALHIQFAGQEADVEVAQTTPADMRVGAHGWDGSVWRKLPLIWGYSDRWVVDLGETKDGDGNYEKSTTAVGAGEVYVLQAVTFYNETGVRGQASVWGMGGVNYLCLARDSAPAINEVVRWTGKLVLKQGDYVRVQQLNCINNDVLNVKVWGYKMKVAE